MYYYLEALVDNTELNFGSEILKQMLELFFDLIVIFCHTQQGQSDQPSHAFNYRPSTITTVSETCNHMVGSNLISKIEPGLNALDQEDQKELRIRYQ
jgi:hypothetical protein